MTKDICIVTKTGLKEFPEKSLNRIAKLMLSRHLPQPFSIGWKNFLKPMKAKKHLRNIKDNLLTPLLPEKRTP
jgi:hypothetical protein